MLSRVQYLQRTVKRLHSLSHLRLAHSYSYSSSCNYVSISNRSVLSVTVRRFSEGDFKKTLERMKQQQQQAKQNEAEPESNSTEAGTNGETTNSETKTNSDTEDNKATDTKFSIPSFDVRRIGEYLVTAKEAVVENVKLAYAEMTGEKRESFLKREFKQAASYKPPKAADDDEEEGEKEQYTGPSALVHVKDPKSAWESMKERLQDSPFIREMLKRSKKIGRVAADTDIGKKAQNIGRSVQDKIEDAREFWETSQNPLVYTMSGIVENLTGETEEGIAIAEIRKLDPNFVKEEWAEEVKKNLAPLIISAHLRGDTAALKPWLGEAVYAKLAADIRTRKHDGIIFDTNILDIDENTILTKFLEDGGPIIVVIYMVQQINCIRNRKGEIIEGGESEIRAKFYSMAFRQYYDEDTATVSWQVVDYEFAGDIPYY